jgi:hypothetical protein
MSSLCWTFLSFLAFSTCSSSLKLAAVLLRLADTARDTDFDRDKDAALRPGIQNHNEKCITSVNAPQQQQKQGSSHIKTKAARTET